MPEWFQSQELQVLLPKTQNKKTKNLPVFCLSLLAPHCNSKLECSTGMMTHTGDGRCPLDRKRTTGHSCARSILLLMGMLHLQRYCSWSSLWCSGGDGRNKQERGAQGPTPPTALSQQNGREKKWKHSSIRL